MDWGGERKARRKWHRATSACAPGVAPLTGDGGAARESIVNPRSHSALGGEPAAATTTASAAPAVGASPSAHAAARRADGPRPWDMGASGGASASPRFGARLMRRARVRRVDSYGGESAAARAGAGARQAERDRAEGMLLGEGAAPGGKTRKKFRLFRRKLNVNALRWGSTA